MADLAANNPNNQTKLGAHGACEGLVDVVRALAGQVVTTAAAPGAPAAAGGGNAGADGGVVLGWDGGDASNAVGTRVDDEALAKWAMWAIGNMVNVGA